MYHLHTLIHMSYVYPYICLTRKGNTTIIEAPYIYTLIYHPSSLERLGQRFTFFNFFPMMTDDKLVYIYREWM